MTDLVSIIMPSYNTAMYIEESINSVIAQSYTRWELIIVDDHSTDNTDDIVRPYLCDTRIKYKKSNCNYGAAVSRNRALREAKGKWIAFLDSDDIWHKDKLKKQINFMISHNYHFSYTNYIEIDENSRSLQWLITGPRKIDENAMRRYCWPGCLTVMYDADYVGMIQIVNIKKNNDYAMWLKVSKAAECYLLAENLAQYRKGRVGSVSTHRNISLIKWHYRLFLQSEGSTPIKATFFTFANLFFGAYKKIKYRKKIV